MVKGRKTGGRQKGTPNKSTPARPSALSELAALAQKAEIVERRAAQAEAARRHVAADYKAVVEQVLTPALAALRAAVAALEAMMGSPPVSRAAPKRRAANGQKPTDVAEPAHSPDGPPPIREIKAIVAEDGVKPAEAKRIQDREIVTRAEWRPSTNALNGSDPTTH